MHTPQPVIVDQAAVDWHLWGHAGLADEGGIPGSCCLPVNARTPSASSRVSRKFRRARGSRCITTSRRRRITS